MSATRATVNVAARTAALDRMLAAQKRRLEQRIAEGNPLAWDVYKAIYGEVSR